MFNPETDYFNFNRATWHGHEHYSCIDCPFDVLDKLEAIQQHCKLMGHGIDKKGLMTPQDYITSELKQNGALGLRVGLGLLSWNTWKATVDSIYGLVDERKYLRDLGCYVRILIVDNGSKDGTVASLDSMPAYMRLDIYRNNFNRGISQARNIMIQTALDLELDYLLLLDSDIQVVPASTYCMLRYLQAHPKVGCIGAQSSNCTAVHGLQATHLYEIPEHRVLHDVPCAWTQYGMFRVAMFRQGIRFDEGGPFGKPGWGLEDDDLFFQMHQAGWENCYFGGMCYLHRNLRSSHGNLQREGSNPRGLFEERRAYMIHKWMGLDLEPARILAIQAQKFPED